MFLHGIAGTRYFIVAGPTGRFHLDSRGNLVPMPSSALKYTGSLAAFTAALRE